MTVKYTKTIICLANSRKITGRCVAGKEIAGIKIGAWIRPVSRRPAGELSEEDRRLQNGQDPSTRNHVSLIRRPLNRRWYTLVLVQTKGLALWL